MIGLFRHLQGHNGIAGIERTRDRGIDAPTNHCRRIGSRTARFAGGTESSRARPEWRATTGGRGTRAWIDIKYGRANPDDWFGIVPAVATLERAAGKGRETLKLIVKVNPRLGLARNLIPWIIENKAIRLDRPYADYRNAAEADHTADREFHVYELAAAGCSALSQILPRYYGSATDPGQANALCSWKSLSAYLVWTHQAHKPTGRSMRSTRHSPRRRNGRPNSGARIMFPCHGRVPA